MATHSRCDILVERRLRVYLPVLLLRGVENGEIHHKWVAFARNYVLCDYLVGSWVCNFSEVKVGRQDIGLDLIVCDLASVELDDKVLFQALHGVVFLQVREDLF